MQRYGDAARLQATRATLDAGLKGLATIAADCLAAGGAALTSLMVTNFVRGVIGEGPIYMAGSGFRTHAVIIAALTLGVLLWYRSQGHYHRRQALADQLKAVVAGAAIGGLCAAAVQYALQADGSRLLTVSYWALLPVFIVLGRMAARDVLRAAGAWRAPTVVFTCASRAEAVSAFITKRDELGARVDGIVAVNAMDVDATVAAMRDAAERGRAVLYAPAAGDPNQPAVIDRLVMTGTPFMLSPRIGPLPNEAELLDFPPEDMALMEVRDPLGRPLALAAKRAFDMLAAGAALIVLAPVLAVLMAAIRLDGGPALFRQKRVGRNGAVFDCLKLRSMAVDAEARLDKLLREDPEAAREWRAYQKLTCDPRITPVGAIVRKTNLDELPQLINVLRGEMSLVGPRPMMVEQQHAYGDRLTAYGRVRPGITGLWQTNGRNATTFEERARLDAWYVRNWSLWRDVVILARTVREVVASSGR